MSTDPPADFGEAFLSWLRDATEAAWRQVDEWTLEDYQRRGYVGPRWRRGTIVGADAIVYGEDLRTYLLAELGGLIR